jgi:hypothetical protein
MLIRVTQEVFDAFIEATNLPYEIEKSWPLFDVKLQKVEPLKFSSDFKLLYTKFKYKRK